MIEAKSIISPKEPVDKRGWRKLPNPPAWVSMGYAAVAFENDNHQVTVISAVVLDRNNVVVEVIKF